MYLSLLTYFFPIFSFDDGDFDDAEEDEGLDDLENVEDVSYSLTLCKGFKRMWLVRIL